MSRRQKRAIKRQMGKDATEAMSEKIAQFGKLPKSCSACSKPFDKLDRDMVQSWNVVVRQDVVRLFCPVCINKAKEALGECE